MRKRTIVSFTGKVSKHKLSLIAKSNSDCIPYNHPIVQQNFNKYIRKWCGILDKGMCPYYDDWWNFALLRLLFFPSSNKLVLYFVTISIKSIYDKNLNNLEISVGIKWAAFSSSFKFIKCSLTSVGSVQEKMLITRCRNEKSF